MGLANLPALVFFHGWSFDHSIWLPLVKLLSKNYAIYLVDLPGFGRSNLMDWQTFNNYLLAYLPAKFVLVGWSMGGLLATQFALKNPQRVISVINIASSPCFIAKKDWPGISQVIIDKFSRNIANQQQQALKDFFSLQLGTRTSQLLENYLQDYLHKPKASLHNLKFGLDILINWDLRPVLNCFPTSITYFFGKLDNIVPHKTMLVMQKLYPQFKYHLFLKAAHMPFISHQTEFIYNLELLLCNLFL